MAYSYMPRERIEAVAVPWGDHTMGRSLIPYLNLKLHHLLTRGTPPGVEVVAAYDRSYGVSDREKGGKVFNFKRPTAIRRHDGRVLLRCFPGFDYVIHFGSVVASHFLNVGKQVSVTCTMPDRNDCRFALQRSGIPDIPEAKTVVLGYVEALDFLSPDDHWQGPRDFKWKRFSSDRPGSLLIGCQHTYWGDIAGTIVELLAERGVELIVYAGKLGSLQPDDAPNECLAISSKSILPNGQLVEWENLFDGMEMESGLCKHGMHITVPSVLQETNQWLASIDPNVRFVDPEIGHMASAAGRAGLRFSILHIVSDNLARRYEHDLSNERHVEVRERRVSLSRHMARAIHRVIR